MYLTRLKKKKIKMMNGNCKAITNTDKEEKEEQVFILPELWRIVKEFQLDWCQTWKRRMKPVRGDINFTIKCLKTGRFGRFVDYEDKVSFHKVSEKFICSTNSKHLPRTNIRIWFYWGEKDTEEEKVLYKRPFIWLNEQAGRYWTCYHCINRELEYFSRPVVQQQAAARGTHA